MLAVSFLGSLCRVQVITQDGTLVVAQTSAQDASDLRAGSPVAVTLVGLPVFGAAP